MLASLSLSLSQKISKHHIWWTKFTVGQITVGLPNRDGPYTCVGEPKPKPKPKPKPVEMTVSCFLQLVRRCDGQGSR